MMVSGHLVFFVKGIWILYGDSGRPDLIQIFLYLLIIVFESESVHAGVQSSLDISFPVIDKESLFSLKSIFGQESLIYLEIRLDHEIVG